MRCGCSTLQPAELKDDKIKWDVLCQPSDNLVRGYAFNGDYIYAVTHTDAPKYKVVRTSVKHPDWQHAETVIPEAADSIQSITKSKHYLLIVYSDGVLRHLVKYDFASGKTRNVKLPASGTVDVSCPDWKTDRCLVNIYFLDAAADDLRFRCAEGHVREEHFQHRRLVSGL